jgi:crossover junction endodeoxyribonuclease RuvC
MGYGIIAVNSIEVKLIEMSILKLGPTKEVYERLQLIHAKVAQVIALHRPHYFAIEAPFFGKNVQSMLKLGRAQGVAIAAAMQANIPVTEYSPKKIKQSITGNGNASKDQVWQMLQRVLGLTEKHLHYLDASDAVAVALCHHYQSQNRISATGKKMKGWEEFIATNPTRVGGSK